MDYSSYEGYVDKFTEPRVINGLIVAYTLVFVPCILGNVLVIYVVSANRSMRTVTNFFLANLAVSDLCVGIFCILPSMFYYISPSWFLGDIMCKLMFFMRGVTPSVSIVLLTVISVERFIAITLPMHSRRILTLTRMRVVIVFVWILGLGYNAPLLFIYSASPLPMFGNNTLCVVDMYSRPSLLMFTSVGANLNTVLWYLLPLTIMLILYSIIARRLWISSGRGHMSLSEPSKKVKKKDKNYKPSNLHEKGCLINYTRGTKRKNGIYASPVVQHLQASRDQSDISDISSASSEGSIRVEPRRLRKTNFVLFKQVDRCREKESEAQCSANFKDSKDEINKISDSMNSSRERYSNLQ
uniref:Pyroglutamylated RFamide peptide receptor-like n=1 Tax=Saccoglossus kowalevskii TaxID=10224 RepID=A0ABM0M6L2_SACKO|nr:PREDICTED: pyroglutamylated RFamide peptide receptor-like [Saccoglossus kowalevskii]